MIGNESELVLLPEMPFFPWIASSNRVENENWVAAVHSHDDWIPRFADLKPSIVLGSRPTQHRRNEGFVWEQAYRSVHEKYYLPDEEGFWEATWYERGDGEFRSAPAGAALVGFSICTEMWFTEHARSYARQGIHILACPRATELSTVDKWIAGGRAAAVMSGAFCISANRSGDGSGIHWGGSGWIIDPDGQVLGVTTSDEPYLTLELDLEKANSAKETYPRYVTE